MLRAAEEIGAARTAFTDRFGGVSSAPYAELNLGGHVGDDPHAVIENRRRVAAAVDLPTTRVLYMNQVHGSDVAVVDGPWGDAVPDVDALVTTERDLALAVLVADCVPVLLADGSAGVIGVAHAGRPGLVAGVVPRTVAAMREVGARAIEATIGPSVCGLCYEVPEAMQADVVARVPAAAATTRHGTAAVDVAAGVAAQLSAEGVRIRTVPRCTLEDDGFFSYRGARTTGRFAGIAWMPSA